MLFTAGAAFSMCCSVALAVCYDRVMICCVVLCVLSRVVHVYFCVVCVIYCNRLLVLFLLFFVLVVCELKDMALLWLSW